MSGHSKWSSIKHKKGAADAKRGKIFSKLVKVITTAARSNPDPEANSTLRLAISKARAANMPADNIDRAIKKASGGADGLQMNELLYEGYAPGGVAILVQCLTENKNRTAAEVKSTMSKRGGNLGEPGCVAYMFNRKGFTVIEKNIIDEDKLMELAMDNGADDFETFDESYEITCDASDFLALVDVLEKENIKTVESDIKYLPETEITLDLNGARKVLALVEALEDLDDVQEVFGNFDIPEDVQKALENE